MHERATERETKTLRERRWGWTHTALSSVWFYSSSLHSTFAKSKRMQTLQHLLYSCYTRQTHTCFCGLRWRLKSHIWLRPRLGGRDDDQVLKSAEAGNERVATHLSQQLNPAAALTASCLLVPPRHATQPLTRPQKCTEPTTFQSAFWSAAPWQRIHFVRTVLCQKIHRQYMYQLYFRFSQTSPWSTVCMPVGLSLC